MARVAITRTRRSYKDGALEFEDQTRWEFEFEGRTESDDPTFDEVAEREEDLGVPLISLRSIN